MTLHRPGTSFPLFARSARALAALPMVLGLLCTGTGATAQEAWTATKPIKLVVPFSPGGGADVAARLIAQSMEARLGQPVFVENKAGASGAIASDYVYGAAPDGSVLLVGTADTQSMNPHVNKVRFDASKFVPVAGIAVIPFVLMGRPELPAADLPALLALMKSQSLTYSSSGAGAASHIDTSIFANSAKVTNLVHIPYQGAGPALQALAASQVDLMMVPMSSAVQYRSKLRTYGVASLARVDAIKDVPTLAEQGVPVNGDSWCGVLAPPGTPPAITAALSKAIRDTVAAPEMQKKLRDIGMTPVGLTQAEFQKFYGDEYLRWGDAIKAANLKTD